ncbi:MAG: hypothetical protein WBI57_14085 [Desulfobacterales bacterium]
MATIDRKELYKKVWETPITRLAREYGLSDVGFAKICKKYIISQSPVVASKYYLSVWLTLSTYPVYILPLLKAYRIFTWTF